MKLNNSLLFIDMMGVRSLWHKGGIGYVEDAFNVLHDLTANAIKEGKNKKYLLVGHFESDSIVLICRNVKWAMKIGRTIFRNAFLLSTKLSDRRLWLRGAIVPYEDSLGTRESEPYDEILSQVKIYRYHPSLLEAISVEKSGIKGMRLVVRKYPSGKVLRRQLRYPVGGKVIRIAKRLQSLPYPNRLTDYWDVFWMASETEEEWNVFKSLMNKRMRWAAKNPEEFSHAAATQVIFSECGGFVGSTQEAGDSIRMIESDNGLV